MEQNRSPDRIVELLRVDRRRFQGVDIGTEPRVTPGLERVLEFAHLRRWRLSVNGFGVGFARIGADETLRETFIEIRPARQAVEDLFRLLGGELDADVLI